MQGKRGNDLCNWFMLFIQWPFYINLALEITVLKMNQGARRFQHSSKCVCWTPLNRKLPFKWKANDNQIIKWFLHCSNNSHGISSSDLLLRLNSEKVNAEHPLRCLQTRKMALFKSSANPISRRSGTVMCLKKHDHRSFDLSLWLDLYTNLLTFLHFALISWSKDVCLNNYEKLFRRKYSLMN